MKELSKCWLSWQNVYLFSYFSTLTVAGIDFCMEILTSLPSCFSNDHFRAISIKHFHNSFVFKCDMYCRIVLWRIRSQNTFLRTGPISTLWGNMLLSLLPREISFIFVHIWKVITGKTTYNKITQYLSWDGNCAARIQVHVTLCSWMDIKIALFVKLTAKEIANFLEILIKNWTEQLQRHWRDHH